MIRVAIVEDESEAAETLSAYLERYQETAGELFHVTWFQNAVTFLEPYRGFDLVFMDILMASYGRNGGGASAEKNGQSGEAHFRYQYGSVRGSGL